MFAYVIATLRGADLSTSANVVTSLPFLFLGAGGLSALLAGRGRTKEFPGTPLLVFALSLIMVGAGSVFYHWSPSLDHLFWDRLPIAVCLAALACALTNFYSGSRVGSVLLAPSVVLAVSSVVYWYASRVHGREDLRPYIAMQICYAIWAGMVVFGRFSKKEGASGLQLALVLYGAARTFELFQQQIYNGLGFDLGHPLKHLLVALSAFLILRGLIRASSRVQEAPVLQLETASGE